MKQTQTNIEQPNFSNQQDRASKYFNNVGFIYGESEISADVNETIMGYFQERTDGNLESARILTQLVIDTAKAQRHTPMEILDEFTKVDQNQLSAILATYLNSKRVNTSFLGVKNTPRPKPFVERTILF